MKARVATYGVRPIAKQQLAALGSVIALGIPSYVAFSIAVRNLASDDFANFVAIWTFVNTVLLGFFSPIEAQGPLLAHTTRNSQDFDFSLRKVSVAAGIYAGIVLLVGQFFVARSNALTGALLIFCTLTYLFWNEGRSRRFGNRDLAGVFLSSLLYLVFFCIFLLLAATFFPSDYLSYIFCLPFAWAFGNLTLSLKSSWRTERRSLTRFTSPKHDRKYLVLALAGFVSLVPSSLGLILASQRLSDAETFSSYVGIVMLTRLGLTLVNSSTPPISLAYMSDINNKSRREKLLSAHLLFFAAAAVLAVTGFTYLGKDLLLIFFGKTLEMGTSEIALVVVGECILAATVATKTQLLLRGISRSQLSSWLVATLIYFLVTTFVPGLVGLATASVAAGMLVISWQFLVLLRRDLNHERSV